MESEAKAIAKNSKEKVPIGALLLADELILPQDLDFALDHQKYSRKLIGQILMHIGAIEHEDLERTLELQQGESDGKDD